MIGTQFTIVAGRNVYVPIWFREQAEVEGIAARDAYYKLDAERNAAAAKLRERPKGFGFPSLRAQDSPINNKVLIGRDSAGHSVVVGQIVPTLASRVEFELRHGTRYIFEDGSFKAA